MRQNGVRTRRKKKPYSKDCFLILLSHGQEKQKELILLSLFYTQLNQAVDY